MASTLARRDFGPASPDHAGFLVFLAPEAHRYRTHHQSPSETRNPRAKTPRHRQKRRQRGPSSAQQGPLLEHRGPSPKQHRPSSEQRGSSLKQQASSPKQQGLLSTHQAPSLQQPRPSPEQQRPSLRRLRPPPRQQPATEAPVKAHAPSLQCHAPSKLSVWTWARSYKPRHHRSDVVASVGGGGSRVGSRSPLR